VESDLKLEIEAVAMYNRAIETAREGADNASRELFERLLKDEEEHVDWFEAQNAPNERTGIRALSEPADHRRRVTRDGRLNVDLSCLRATTFLVNLREILHTPAVVRCR
jgi:hypothetical protein